MKRFIILIFFIMSLQLLANEDNYVIDEKLKKFLTKEEITYIQNKKIIFASNEFDYEPMDFNVNGIATGYSIDLLDALAKSAGLKVKYTVKNWTELLDDFHNGKIDLMHTIYKTPVREKSMSFSLPYLIGDNYFIIRKDSKSLSNLDELEGKKIGISKGWAENPIVSRYPKIKKIYFYDLKDKLEALSSGKVDAIMSDKNIANYYIKKYGFTNLKISNPVSETKNGELDKYYFATLRENSILVSILNKAYINIDINVLDKLQENWFGNSEDSILSIKEQEYLNQKKKINVCILPNLIPLTHYENGKAQGIVYDVLEEMKDKIHVSFNLISRDTLAENVIALLDAECDLIPTLEKKEDNENFDFTTPYLKIPYVAIGKEDKHFFSDLSELDGKTISIIADTLLVDRLKKLHPTIKFKIVRSIQKGLSLVKSGEVYVHLSLYPVAKYYISKTKYNNLKIIGRIIEPMEVAMVTRNDDPMLSSIMEKFIKNLSEPKIETILNNWTEVRVQKVIDYSLFYKIFAGVFVLIILGVWRYKVLKNANSEIRLINEKLHKSQKQLIKQKEEFEAIFRCSKDGIAILDLDSTFIDFNDAYLKMLRYSRKELLDKKFIDVIAIEDKDDVEDIMNKILENSYVDNFERVYVSKDEKRIFVNMTISLMPDKNRVLVTAKDLTSMKLLESQSKLASMGEMIGNIAHQWRQPLSIITTSASGLAIKIDMEENFDKKEIVEFSNQIVKQAEYLSKTIDDFRNFIKSDIHHSAISVKEALENALILTKASVKSNYIESVEHIVDDIIIDGNKSELGQVFINIINNAKDKLAELDQNKCKRYLFISTKKLDEKTFQVKFLDNGGGINESVINRIFEPYFTTKHQSIGTGLGLSMCDKIIRERHSGTIEAYNEEYQYLGTSYKGAVFLLTFYVNR